MAEIITEPTWTTGTGQVLKLSEMDASHLLNAQHMMWERCRDNPLSQIWYKVRDLTRELAKRGYHHNKTLALAEERCKALDATYKKEVGDGYQYKFPQYEPQKVTEAKAKNEKLAQETREINWQNLEAQMLPEGDKHIIAMERFIDIHPITRRITHMYQSFPTIYDSKQGKTHLNLKKCRITIEVLED